ncbi:MAG: acyl-CoA thioesterase [Ignavibacteriales bacterium]|nr:acyl-CoA thioesterase [Ignavibacteriales bacterium]
MDKKDFKFKTQIRVRNYEVDWQGIVHNANYLLYCEIGRIEYLKHLGIKIDLSTMQSDSRVVLVRNEINYKSPAKFDEVLNIYTRIAKIGNTSFIFEGFLEEEKTQRLVADNVAYHVWLAPNSEEPMTVPNEFREKVKKFEELMKM